MQQVVVDTLSGDMLLSTARIKNDLEIPFIGVHGFMASKSSSLFLNVNSDPMCIDI